MNENSQASVIARIGATVFLVTFICAGLFTLKCTTRTIQWTYTSEPNVQITPAKQVILLTHGRSGSSWLGELLNYNPNALYYFEPLHALKEDIQRRRQFLYTTGKTEQAPGPKDATVSIRITENFLNCHFENVPLSVLAPGGLKHSWFTIGGRHRQMSRFKSCILYETDDRPCIPLLTSACQNASIVSFKTIRMTLRMTAGMLERNPALKILYLIRDPRATMLSSWKTFEKLRTETIAPVGINLFNFIRGYCKNVGDNANMYQEMETKFPGRILVIRYEDAIKDPVRKAEEVYQFLGHRMPSEVRDFVRDSASAKEDNGVFGTSRTDPAQTAYKWVPTIPLKLVELVENECSHGMKYFNYTPYDKLRSKYDEILSQLE
ncbi:carbohydrate sulfotransferase 3 [Lingula anatina]|uniref:Carbohydrate sulfotransferase 3 n=1 Tax=Lingula anatina TaxID=7574 RepID=A0A1S3KHM7_LINAN|nr:carbohydrate sulfotransferase 3 [Lingula anatina]|eukprot:XP_013421979.1 carbohydrate sulfotransferase 3 [Lingula anatina]